MNRLLFTRGKLLLALGLLLAVGAAGISARWYELTLRGGTVAQPAKSAESVNPAKAELKSERDEAANRMLYIPGRFPGQTQTKNADAEELRTLEDYWNAHITFPTGYFDGSWLLEAAQQDRKVKAGVPAGQPAYSRGDSKSPLALRPNSFTPLGPSPAQSDGCWSCFNYGKVSGRVNTIAVNPANPSIAFIGVDGGGVWKTTNCCSAATTWTSTTDDPLVSTTAIDEVTIDPNHPDTVYAATGDFRLGLNVFGANGILKSTNQGASWAIKGADVFTPTFELAPSLPNAYRWQYQAVSAIKVDPRNSNNLVAGTKTGLFFSYDAGDTWAGPCYTNVFTQTQRQDVTEVLLQDHGASTTVLAAQGFPNSTGSGGTTFANGANGVYTATIPTSGCPANWSLTTTENDGWPAGTGNGTPANGKPGRIDLAIAPSNPNVIYAEVSHALTNALLGLWRSTDGGVTWQQRATGAALVDCQGASGTVTPYNQQWYDQAIDVDPNNPDVIYMSGVDIWKSTDGGTSFWDVACGYSGGTTIHVDQHDTRYIPGASNMLLQGNDGGIYVTSNADVISPTKPSWVEMNQSLNTIEFYGGDTTANFATAPQPGANGGAQDNGSMLTVWSNPGSLGPQEWQVRKGGDGMYARIEPVFGQRWYQESQNGSIDVSVEGPYGPRQSVTGGWVTETRAFVFPYEIFRGNPNDPANDCNPTTGCTHLIAGSQRVWETVQGGIPASSWYPNSPNLTRGVAGRSYINQLTYSPSISTTAMVGTMDGYVWYGTGLGQGTPNSATWTNVTTDTTTFALPGRSVLDVAIDPSNPLIGYAAMAGFDQNTPGASGHVFRLTCTANCATSAWTNKTGNLPNIPFNTITVNPHFPQQVFAGSDLGLYYTNDITANPPTWLRFNAGLPNVKVWDLSIDRGSTTLTAWTRSRGAYSWPLPNAPFIQPTPTFTPTGTPPTATRTGTPTRTPTSGPCFNYTTTTGTAAIMPGTVDIGNHCDDCATTVQIPFPVNFYDQTFSSGYATSNGAFIFGPAVASLANACLPDRNERYSIILFQNDQCTVDCGGQTCPTCGIFTATVGTAPNRQLIVEWRTIYFSPAQGSGANYEVIFTENSSTIRVIYGQNGDSGRFEVSGVQQSADTRWTQFSCDTATLTPGLLVDYVRNACPTSTPTSTATRTATPPAVCRGCGLVSIRDENISCNPDQTVHWDFGVSNRSECMVQARWTAELFVKRGSGGFTGVMSIQGTSTLQPGDTRIGGDFCYVFPHDVRSQRVELRIEYGEGHCTVNKKTHQIDRCDRTTSCSTTLTDTKAVPNQ
ncbi:MAG: hypothetical protein ACJ78Q_00455 [Chloroflexia bacterium]